jgi:hypothetical protein
MQTEQNSNPPSTESVSLAGTPRIVPPQYAFSDEGFWAWSFKRTKRLWALLLVATGVASSIYNFIASTGVQSSARLPLIYGVHALVVLVISGFIAFAAQPKAYEGYDKGSEAVHQFWRAWPLVWFGWILVYSGLTLKEVLPLTLKANDMASGENGVRLQLMVESVLHAVSNFSTLQLLMCFHVLAEPRQPGVRSEALSKTDKALAKADNPFGAIFAGLSSTSGGPQPSSGGQLEAGNAQRFFWASLFVILTLLELTFVATLPIGKPSNAAVLYFDAHYAVNVAGIVSGVAAGVSLALLVGRLDSKFLGTPRSVLALLFLYASIQGSFPVVLSPDKDLANQIVKATIISIALLGKILLFGTIQWLMSTNRLLYYMVWSSLLQDFLSSHRRDFCRDLGRD